MKEIDLEWDNFVCQIRPYSNRSPDEVFEAPLKVFQGRLNLAAILSPRRLPKRSCI